MRNTKHYYSLFIIHYLLKTRPFLESFLKWTAAALLHECLPREARDTHATIASSKNHNSDVVSFMILFLFCFVFVFVVFAGCASSRR